MEHRHLNHDELTLAAVDDLIARGKRGDWERLGAALAGDGEIAGKIRRVCAARIADPAAQRYHFWKGYVDYVQSATA